MLASWRGLNIAHVFEEPMKSAASVMLQRNPALHETTATAAAQTDLQCNVATAAASCNIAFLANLPLFALFATLHLLQSFFGGLHV